MSTNNPVVKAKTATADIGYTGGETTIVVNPAVKARGVDDAIFTSVLYANFGCVKSGVRGGWVANTLFR